MLVRDLRLHICEYCFSCFHMLPSTFEELLSFVAPIIAKESTVMRDPIEPSQRLALTVSHLVTGDAQHTIAASYRISPTAITRVLSETRNPLWDSLLNLKFIDPPSTEAQWREIAAEFETKWNFPHALGAIDGKHVPMQAPHNSGSEYFTYKKTHSIVLLAMCNARYKFLLVDIGDSGRQSDGSVYNNSHLGHAIEPDKINPDRLKLYPFGFVADDAFGLKPHMMKPYPNQNLPIDQRIFNYQLLRVRRVIENTFGIATSRVRVFCRPIIAKIEKVKSITKAVVALHTYLLKKRIQNNENNYNFALMPFLSVNDEHFDWLNSTFLQYFKNWLASIERRPGNCCKGDEASMFISHQTYTGIQITVKSVSVTELTKYLLSHGVQCVLTERFCKDHLENYFGRMHSDNPFS